MSRNNKLNLITALLAAIAIVMIVLGIIIKVAAPTLTGVGFLLIAWALQILK